ncbi:MAG: phosphoenolpyruvate-utilizing N-terminal domain-containing protein, partial [Steroidobacteraceae bacterium]
GQGIAHESAEFERARAEVRTRLEHLVQHSKSTAREVIAAHLEFLDDWELVAAARRSISPLQRTVAQPTRVVQSC